MLDTPRIYVVGAGVIGMSLAALLAGQGHPVTAVRTSIDGLAPTSVAVTVELPGKSIQTVVETASMTELEPVDNGIVALTAKATANKVIAGILKEKFATFPLVVMQNGLGVEQPFIEAGLTEVYRCVLYATGQSAKPNHYRFREVSASPVGAVNGSPAQTRSIVEQLSTPAFRFRAETDIAREAWKKSIINAAFNSICPLLDVDNGIFHRDAGVAAMAAAVIDEASAVAARAGIHFGEHELTKQLLHISRRADGQLISTLQDLNHGRETEIDFLNMEIARVGAALQPPVDTPVTRLLGEMIFAKSRNGCAKT